MKTRGSFITFEGPEGSGKSTHVRQLAKRLGARGLSVLTVREPGGTPLGEAIRNLLQYDAGGEGMVPETELFLFMASRAQLVRQFVQPALNQGTHVICDRFADSTTAYQGYGRGCDVEEILRMNALAVGNASPDLTILLDLDVRAGFERLQERNQQQNAQCDRIEREALAFHERVRTGYLELARRWPKRIHVVDAARETDVVDEDIWKLVQHVIET